MQPVIVPEARGKKVKITSEVVRRVVDAATGLQAQGKKLRLGKVTAMLAREDNIRLSRKKVTEILIANGLYAVRSRRKRPRFYQRLRQTIPNGLVSADGSEFTVWVDAEPFTFNVELAVDVDSFAHTAFRVGDTETSEEVVRVLETHRSLWGSPLGFVCDHDSANLSARSRDYLAAHGIELVAAGPANPKGNGTVEGAFSQMKEAVLPIELTQSSPRALARAVLEKLIAVYISMRNRLAPAGPRRSPLESMAQPQDECRRALERRRLKDYLKAKDAHPDEQAKLARLQWLIGHHRLTVAPAELSKARSCITAYDLEAVTAAEQAFVKAVNRKKERCSLAYFFGILRRIQQQRDEYAYQRYCRERYLYQERLEAERRQQQHAEQTPTVADLVALLREAVVASVRFVKELAIRRAQKIAHILRENYRYLEPLMKQIRDTLGESNDLSLAQKQQAWDLAEQFIRG
jgi:transposase InsO family protein